MSATQIAVDLRSFLSFGDPREGWQSESLDCIQAISEDDVSVTLGERIRQAESALHEACMDSARENWDGYGAKHINGESSVLAIRFLKMLPATIPIPEISIDPDGEVSFEWYKEPRRIFSVSVGAHNDLSYAGLFGVNDTHGTEYFGDEIPTPILENLRRFLS